MVEYCIRGTKLLTVKGLISFFLSYVNLKLEQKAQKLKQRMQSFRYAIEGISTVIRDQANMKIHLAATICVVLAGLYFKLNQTEWCLIVICITSVLAAEVFNSAIEYLSDTVTTEQNPLIKKTKDAAAGAVLLIAIGAAICGGIIFLPKILEL